MTHALIREALNWLRNVGSQADGSEYGEKMVSVISEALTTQGWRTDMENAPRDGTPVDLVVCDFLAKTYARFTDCIWKYDTWVQVQVDGDYVVCPYGFIKPTAWMLPPELPAPPTPNEE